MSGQERCEKAARGRGRDRWSSRELGCEVPKRGEICSTSGRAIRSEGVGRARPSQKIPPSSSAKLQFLRRPLPAFARSSKLEGRACCGEFSAATCTSEFRPLFWNPAASGARLIGGERGATAASEDDEGEEVEIRKAEFWSAARMAAGRGGARA